jgi:trimethylamine--corrinoid protein Co-methyltransferase
MEMVRIAGGLTHEEFDATPRMYTNINSVSPLKHDFPMLDGAMRLARRGQPVVVTPFTLAGAMAPVTMAGAVALSLAEGLAAIALLQWIAPGCPVAIGTFTSNVDMKSGAPAFGTPEYMRATQMTGQMARYYGLPMRASGVCAANVPDGQAMWETANSLWSAVQSGTNIVYHAAGWLEGGLIASPEKFVMDCEVIQQIQRYFEPQLTATTEDDLGIEAIARGRRGRAFLRLRAYAGALHDGVLPAVPVGLAQLRGVAAGRRRLDGGAGQQASTSDPGGIRAAADGRGASARNLRPSWRGARKRAARRPISEAPTRSGKPLFTAGH